MLKAAYAAIENPEPSSYRPISSPIPPPRTPRFPTSRLIEPSGFGE
jgi:hypothetical protein